MVSSMQEELDLSPPVVVGEGDLWLVFLLDRHSQPAGEPGAGGPVDEDHQRLGPAREGHGVVLEVGLGGGGDGLVAGAQPAQEPCGGDDAASGSRDGPVGQGARVGLDVEAAQEVPAGEPGDDVGVVFGQRGQDVVQPWGDPFQLGVIGRQDTDSGKEVPQVGVGPVRGHRGERGVGDLDLSLCHGPQDGGSG